MRAWIGFSASVFSLALCVSPSRAVDRTWNNAAGGVFNSTLNWSGSTVPQAGDNAIFSLNTPGYIVTFTSGPTHAGAFVRTDSVTFNLSALTYTLNSATTAFAVGDQTNNVARATFQNGSFVTNNAVIGAGSGSSGVATLTTGGSWTCNGQLTLGLGSFATAALVVNSGGRLTNGITSLATVPGGAGSITVTNAGSGWTCSNFLTVGLNGAGTVSIVNGGTASLGPFTLGLQTGSAGTMLLDGGGSTVTAAGGVSIGELASGNLLISNGGSFGAQASSVGNSAAGAGSVTVNGGTWSHGFNITVGNAGVGIVNLNNSSRATCTDLRIGDATTGTGSLTINSNSSLIASATARVGINGRGSISLLNGGSLASGAAVIGDIAGDGSVTVAGGSRWANTGGLVVGASARGNITVLGGGSITTGSLTIADSPSAAGTVALGGLGSSLSGGSWTIGSQGAAVLRIASAATGSCTLATIGSAAGSDGTVTVDGTFSVWTNSSGPLTVANNARGTLNVTNGGLVNSAGGNVASGVGSTGVATLAAAGATWNSTASLYVGGNSLSSGGSGAVNVAPGGKLLVAGGIVLRVYPTGALNILGGTVSTGSLDVLAGAVNFDAGTLQITGLSGLTIGTGAPLGATFDLGAGKNLLVSNELFITAAALLSVSGGNVSAGSILSNGEIFLQSHLSQLTCTSNPLINSGLIDGDGRISGKLTNNGNAEVRVSSGQRISFSNAGSLNNTNGGQINLFGGTIEFDQLLSNVSGGRVTGRGTIIAHGGSAMNAGAVMTLSGGTSDVLGNLTNNSAGKVIVTGGSTSTFFDAVTNNSGSEFRVSTASTAVFLGSVSGLGQFTGPGTKDFEGPTSFGALDTTGTTIIGPSATLLASHVRETALLVEGRATIAPNGSAAGTSVVKELSIEGGAAPTGFLDLNDNALVIDHDGTSPIASLTAQIAFAYHGGTWDRPGITSALADATTHGLGVAERSALTSVPAIFGAVDADAVLIRYTRYGDANLDGAVNLPDFNALASSFGTSGRLWYQGDFTYDGVVDLMDFNRLASNFGLAALAHDPTPQDWSTLAAAVPEPAALLLLSGVPALAGMSRAAGRSCRASNTTRAPRASHTKKCCALAPARVLP